MAKTISEEQRKKISESMKGRKLSEEHKAKLRESMKGVNTWECQSILSRHLPTMEK